MNTFVGDLISKKREEAGLPQAEVALRLGLTTPQFISNIERGQAPLPAQYVRPLAIILKMDFRDLEDAQITDMIQTYQAKVRA